VSPRIQVVALPSEASEFTDDLDRLFLELGRSALTGECSPPLDVFETDEAIEIAMDLPAVEPPPSGSPPKATSY
jgi:HSP20 family molecular chaperone IbpA